MTSALPGVLPIFADDTVGAMDLSRQYAETRDAQDPIGHFRTRFHIADEQLV
ncbi:hypothetical protein AB0J72_38960 [Dactylosporangium sp. NPDC049742]|uniref:hypothetical protein n=1 Tax=Dactylosporangium sp. NPDC049742 TaxID=3154737 RepID=UPI0034336F94